MANVFGTIFDDNGIFNPILNGTALADNIWGNGGNDTLRGFSGNDFLDGGSGIDTMEGGTGNDTYVVDNAGDVVVEAVGQGIDTVQSSISYTLGANVENLTLIGAASINGTGNTLNNTITGNAANNNLFGLGGADTLSGLGGNDLLNGGLGADIMEGGIGNDTYVVDNAGDVVVEAAGQGTDRVISTISYILGANVENLSLTGVGNINGTGNALNNSITGNIGANTLLGGDGIDTINGGAGNDTIVGESGADILTGSAGLDNFRFNTPNQGIDQITDFVVADDTIQVLQAAFPVVDPATGLPVNLALGAIGAGQFRLGAGAADANDYFIYNPASGALTFDRNGSAAGGSIQLAQLPAGLAMTANDIVVIA